MRKSSAVLVAVRAPLRDSGGFDCGGRIAACGEDGIRSHELVHRGVVADGGESRSRPGRDAVSRHLCDRRCRAGEKVAAGLLRAALRHADLEDRYDDRCRRDAVLGDRPRVQEGKGEANPDFQGHPDHSRTIRGNVIATEAGGPGLIQGHASACVR